MNKTIITITALVATAASLVGCQSDDTASKAVGTPAKVTETTEAPTTTQRPVPATTEVPTTTPTTTQAPTTTAAPTPEVDPEAMFKVAMLGDLDLIESAATNMGQAGEAAQNMNLTDAVTFSAAAGRDFRALIDTAQSAPGADTTLGILVIGTFETCAEANETGSVAIATMDLDGIEASTTLLGECTSMLGLATDAIA